MNKRIGILVFGLLFIFLMVGYFAREDIKKLWQKTSPTPIHQDHINITFLNIGQGDASFIEFQNGEQMLVDCSEDAKILEALGRVMSFRDRTIDYLLITHPHTDHYGGCIDVLKRYEVKNIIFTDYTHHTNSSVAILLNTIQQEQAVLKEIRGEETWSVASTTLHFLYPDAPAETRPVMNDTPDNANNMSIVFLLQFGNEKVLFTGDAEAEVESYLIKKYGQILDSDILKAGHHGSQTSSGDDFLKVVTPKITTISSGKGNEYGHPSLRTLKRLERVHSQIWRTDEKGDILIQIYPDHLYVQNH